MFARVKEAVADVAETLRRAFQGAAVREVPTGFSAPGARGCAALETRGHGGLEPLLARADAGDWGLRARVAESPMAFPVVVGGEDAWRRWASETHALAAPLFTAGRTSRMDVPPLPRKAVARRGALEAFRVGSRQHHEPLRTPAVRRVDPGAARPRTRADLPRALRQPMLFQGRDFASLPKGLQMRYSLRLVKETGGNIRELDVLGLFRVPRKGVGSMRVDAHTGRLVAGLTAEACTAARGLLLLARRREDQAILSCFVEES